MGFLSFLSVFYSHSTFGEKKFILTISLMYGILAPALTGIAVWFKTPQLICTNSDGLSFPCIEKEACDNGYDISISDESSASIASTLAIICTNMFMKKMILQAYFLGGVLGCLSNIFLPIPANKRKLALVFIGFIHAAANFSIVFNSNNMYYLQCSFGLLSFSMMILHSNLPLILNESFVGDLAKSSISLILMFWGFIGICFSAMSYFNDADFFRGFSVMGFLAMACSLHLFFIDEPEVHENLQRKKMSIFSLTKQVWKDKQITFNLVTYCFGWVCFAVTYNQVLIKIEAVGGTLFFNLGVLSVLEFSATFIGSYIGSAYQSKLGDVIRYVMIFESILSAFFIFAPCKPSNLPPVAVFVLFISMALVKICSDVVNNLINLFAPKIFTIQYVGLFLAFSRLASRLLLYNVPTINEALEHRDIHPFIFVSSCWLICSIMALNVKPVKVDPVSSQALFKRRSSSKILNVKVEVENGNGNGNGDSHSHEKEK